MTFIISNVILCNIMYVMLGDLLGLINDLLNYLIRSINNAIINILKIIEIANEI